MVWELWDGTKVNFSSCIFNHIKFQKPNETMVNAFGTNLGAWMNYKFTRIDQSHHNPNLRKGIPYDICYNLPPHLHQRCKNWELQKCGGPNFCQVMIIKPSRPHNFFKWYPNLII
jgi:hypothetical protein